MEPSEIFAALKAPFDPKAISWRVGSTNADKTSGLALAYIDARDVMERLDSVLGPENWQDSYTETHKGRLMCTLSLRIGSEWINKSDGAGDTDVEGEKGAISDALKRAAVHWGIGRYLYNLDAVWVDCVPAGKSARIKDPASLYKKLPAWAIPAGAKTPPQKAPQPEPTQQESDIDAAKKWGARYWDKVQSLGYADHWNDAMGVADMARVTSIQELIRKGTPLKKPAPDTSPVSDNDIP